LLGAPSIISSRQKPRLSNRRGARLALLAAKVRSASEFADIAFLTLGR
jgi:hypothetical protein